jgi:RNA polymerase sigma factor (sigma-70 family)
MEQNAFEQIACKLRQEVVSWCQHNGTGGDEAEDIAQEVMLKLWSMHSDLERYRSVDGLALLMAKHLAVNQGRKCRPTPLGEQELQIADGGRTPSEMLEHDEAELSMAQMMASLPDTQHTILRMRQVEHRSNSEIARVLGLEETSVNTLLSRARKALMEMMRQQIIEENKHFPHRI